MKKYSIIVPIFNEEKNIINFFLEFEKFIDKFLNENFELVIVNDGSTDHSKNIILEWSKRNIKLNHKIIHNQINSGYGNALKKGILNSINRNKDLQFKIIIGLRLVGTFMLFGIGMTLLLLTL